MYDDEYDEWFEPEDWDWDDELDHNENWMDD